MMRWQIPMLTASALALAACSVSTKSAEIAASPPEAVLLQRCEGPVDLPDRALTQAETEILWGRDRGALVKCARVQAALADYAGGRVAELRGEGVQ